MAAILVMVKRLSAQIGQFGFRPVKLMAVEDALPIAVDGVGKHDKLLAKFFLHLLYGLIALLQG